MNTPLLRIVRGGSLLAMLISAGAPATAEPIFFLGADNGAGPGQPRPFADRAAASFDAAAGMLDLVNFEDTPLGNFTSLLIAPGVSLSKSQTGGGVVNLPGTATDGYNTTPGGERYVNVLGAGLSNVSLNFSFQQPIQAFGTYVTGAQEGRTQSGPLFSFTITAADGTQRGIPVNPLSIFGGALFVGFTDTRESIREFTLSSSGDPASFSGGADTFSVDDVRFGVIPEPSTFLLVSLALVGLCEYGWRRS